MATRSFDELRAAILDAVDHIAPGSSPVTIDNDLDIRDQFDLDSMDLLNLVAELDARLGVTVPDADVEQITTLANAIAYLQNATDRNSAD